MLKRLKEVIFIICGLIILPFHSLYSKDKFDPHAASNHVEAFGKKIAQMNGMKFLNDGCGTCVGVKSVAFDISLMANKQWTIEQARPVVVAIMNNFFNTTIKDRAIYDHMQYLGTSWKSLGYDPVLTPKRLGLRLAFWDKNVNRPPKPYVSQIIVAEGMINYRMASPIDQSLEAPFTETLEEAAKIVSQQQKK